MKTAKQELEETLSRYNNKVNDVSKFKFNQREAELFTSMMHRYATEAIKADRERIKQSHADELPNELFNDLALELGKDIDNLPIELP